MTGPFVVGLAMGTRQYLRNTLFVVLMFVLPPAFISLSFVTTPDLPLSLGVVEGSRTLNKAVAMPELHGALMVPMTVAFLSGFLGLFVMFSARQGDRRLVIAGYSPTLLLAIRLTMVVAMSTVITLISVGVTLISFQPEQPWLFFWSSLVSALQYGFLGAATGTFLGSMSGTYLMFFVPMIDIGLIQNPMFSRESVQWWAKALPGYAPMEVLTDVSFTAQFDTLSFLGIAVAYVVAVAGIAAVLFHRVMANRL